MGSLVKTYYEANPKVLDRSTVGGGERGAGWGEAGAGMGGL